jgi:hypothetical protein
MGCTKWYRSHQWNKWITTSEGNITVDGKRVGDWFIQTRICPMCGAEQRRVRRVE